MKLHLVLRKNTADSLKQFQDNIKQLHRKVTDFAKAFTKENPETKTFLKNFNFTDPEPQTIYELQSKLISDCKKAKVNYDNLKIYLHNASTYENRRIS